MDFQRIFSTAAPLEEAIDNSSVQLFDPGDQEYARMVSTWQERVFEGNRELFDQRLQMEGLTEAGIREKYFSAEPAPEEPNWAGQFTEITNRLSAFADVDYAVLKKQADEAIEGGWPFKELVYALSSTLNQMLAEQLKPFQSVLTPKAHNGMHMQTAALVSDLFGTSLMLEFQLYRQKYQNPFEKMFGAAEEAGTEHYEAFVMKQVGDSFAHHFESYPVLVRALSIKAMHFISAMTELLKRFTADHELIEQQLGINTKAITRIKTGIADTHNNGRAVVQLELEGGDKLIYKPKPLLAEARFYELLEELNPLFAGPDFRPLGIVNRDSYGWVEFLETSGCTSRGEVERYYKRTGALVALLYVLRSSDYHLENIIACGEHPMLIDLETIMHPPAAGVKKMEPGTAAERIMAAIGESVFKSGLLPRWQKIKESFVDFSGLGSAGEQLSPYRSPVWKNVNTDAMNIEFVTRQMPVQGNVLSLDGEIQTADAYADELLEGFTAMYRFIMEKKESIPFALLKDIPLRFVHRHTNSYARLFRQMLHEKYSSHGLWQSVWLDLLSILPLTSVYAEQDITWGIMQSEKRQMLNYDIPSFYINADSTTLYTHNGTEIRHAVAESAYDRLLKRLEELCENDLTAQQEFISGSLHFKVSGEMNFTGLDTESDIANAAAMNREELVHQAAGLGERIAQKAVYGSDGTVGWMSVGYNPEIGKSEFRPMAWNFYDGLPGILLFLTALSEVTKDERSWELVEGGLLSLKQMLEKNPENNPFFLSGRFGAGTGAGSIVYPLTIMHRITGDEDHLELALRFASHLTPERIVNDMAYDVLAGSAGLILALDSLYLASGEPSLPAQIEAAAEHLLSARKEAPGGAMSIPSRDGKFLAGFSHGAAGFALAMIRAAAATGREYYLDTAREFLAYEKHVFHPNEKNWPDLRVDPVDGKYSYMTAWCNGAAGIGYMRLAAADQIDVDFVKDDLKAAIENAVAYPMILADHVCCGNLSIVDFLYEAGRESGDTALVDLAMKRVALMTEKARRQGGYSYYHDPRENIFNPAFFQGAAGIGYHLLRYAYPKKLPRVLLFE